MINHTETEPNDNTPPEENVIFLQETPAGPEMSSDNGERCGIWSVSFIALLVTQFCVAFNDNMFRWLVVPIGTYQLGKALNDLEQGQKWSLMLGMLVFLLPFVILVGPAGYFSDRFSKRSVIRGCKLIEIPIMVLGLLAIYLGNIPFLFVVLFFMGAQSTIFSPSKYGSIPELVPAEQITSANGLVAFSTMAAVILGTVCGGTLFTLTSEFEMLGEVKTYTSIGQSRIWISALALIGVAVFGWLTSLLISPIRPGNRSVRFPYNPISGVVSDMRLLFSYRSIFYVTFGSAYYWGVAALAQSNIDKYILPEFFPMDARGRVSACLGILTIGIAIGAIAAGVISKGKLNMKIPALASMGMAVCCFGLAAVPGGMTGYWTAAAVLFCLGICAGMYDIPLMSYIQEKSPESNRGRVIASSNFISNSAMLLAAAVFAILTITLGLTARNVWVVVGLTTIPVAAVFLYYTCLKQITYLFCWGYLRIFYRIERVGLENVPKDRPVMYISNHISYLDGPMVLIFSPGAPRMLIWSAFVQNAFMKRLCHLFRGIPISHGREAFVAIKEARASLQAGENVGIFPEGAIARWGVIQPFQPGVMKAVKNTDAVIIPIYLGGIWGSIFSYFGQKFIWKVPVFSRRRVTMIFGEPIENASTNRFELYQAVKKLENQYFEMEHSRELRLAGVQPKLPVNTELINDTH